MTRASGGVVMVLPRSTPAKKLPFCTNLEAVTVQVGFHRVITVCPLYLALLSSD